MIEITDEILGAYDQAVRESSGERLISVNVFNSMTQQLQALTSVFSVFRTPPNPTVTTANELRAQWASDTIEVTALGDTERTFIDAPR